MAAPAAPASSREFAELIDLSQRLGLVGLGTGPQVGGSARLVASSDFGRSFTAISPRTAAWTVTDDVFFLNRMDGWFAVFNVDTVRETLYRTRDGGHSWQAFPAPSHNVAGGAVDTVQFLTPSEGWLTQTMPTAPREGLFMTRDGGRSWHLMTSAPLGRLPALGPVEFEPGGHIGWLGGGMFSNALYRTSDQGRSWHRAAIQTPAGSWFGLPALLGSTLLEPVVTGSPHELRLYRSTDGGARWSLVSTLPAVAVRPGTCGPALPSTSFPSRTVAWAAAAHGRRTVVYRTTDQGRHWTAIKVPGTTPADTCQAPQVQALDATHAWLLDRAAAASTRPATAATSGVALTPRRWPRAEQPAPQAAGACAASASPADGPPGHGQPASGQASGHKRQPRAVTVSHAAIAVPRLTSKTPYI